MSSFDPRDIHAFLAGLSTPGFSGPDDERLQTWRERGLKASLFSYTSGANEDLDSIHMGYAPSFVSSKSGRSSTRSTSTRSASTTSSAVSRVFSHKSDKSCSTASSSRPPSTASTAPSVFLAHAIPNPPHNPQCILPCEYARLGLCNETFGPDETALWEEHIVVDHFDRKLPPHCICWFCDKEFGSSDYNVDDSSNFKFRLDHIREHFLQSRLTVQEMVQQMRPDYFLLEHLHLNRLLPEALYQRECKLNEGPRASGVVRHDFIPQERRREKELRSRVVHDNEKEERRRRRDQKQQQPRRRTGQLIASSNVVGTAYVQPS
ncbi:hypothetical protein PG996_003592 [Apiospora saccharicola]|uniref:Uncharacterized protein n=1 Tax=Apiospora saccharicola TaxID=335842 RepID=A0ABR1W2X6_9PEZI